MISGVPPVAIMTLAAIARCRISVTTILVRICVTTLLGSDWMVHNPHK